MSIRIDAISKITLTPLWSGGTFGWSCKRATCWEKWEATQLGRASEHPQIWPRKKPSFLKERRKKPIIFLKTSIPSLLDIFCNTILAEVIWGQIWKSKKKSTFIRQNYKTFKGGLNFRRYFHFGDWSYHQKMFEIIILNFFTLKSWKLGPKWKYLLRLLVSNL